MVTFSDMIARHGLFYRRARANAPRGELRDFFVETAEMRVIFAALPILESEHRMQPLRVTKSLHRRGSWSRCITGAH
jgi:hypothetical protein